MLCLSGFNYPKNYTCMWIFFWRINLILWATTSGNHCVLLNLGPGNLYISFMTLKPFYERYSIQKICKRVPLDCAVAQQIRRLIFWASPWRILPSSPCSTFQCLEFRPLLYDHWTVWWLGQRLVRTWRSVPRTALVVHSLQKLGLVDISPTFIRISGALHRDITI